MVAIDGVITGVSVAHQFADVETIADATPADPDATLAELCETDGVQEAFLLCTCNRAEWYVVTEHAGRGEAVIEDSLEGLRPAGTRLLRHDESIEHLLRVASGLESQVLGEDEILGQFKTAYHRAKDAGAIGSILDPVLLKAIHVGERARSETSINEGIVSLASAAAACADEHVDLPTATGLVVGAGDIGTRAVKALIKREIGELVVANRSEPSLDIPETTDIRTVDLDQLSSVIDQTSICITATSASEPVIQASDVSPSCSVTIIDLGQPPDVAPSVQSRASVAYYDLDRLRTITERTHSRRAEEAATVEGMIERELDQLQRRFKRSQAETVIAAMRAGADRLKDRELHRAKVRLEEGDADAEEVLEDLADALVNVLMAAPTEGLRDAAEDDDWSTIHAAIQIFDPDVDDEVLPEEMRDMRAAIEDD